VQNFRKLTEMQSSEVFRFSGELSGEGVQALYSVVLQVLWSTSTSQYLSISTLTMMYLVLCSTSTSQYWFCSTGILWCTELLYYTHLYPNHSGVLVHLSTALVHLFYDVLRYCTLERQPSTISTVPGQSCRNPCILDHGILQAFAFVFISP
jgi:hypothetical protein